MTSNSSKKYQFLPNGASGWFGQKLSGQNPKSDLLLVVTIDLGDGESDQIRVHQSDSVEQLAADFCEKHKLTEESYVFVIENIRQNIQAMLAQQNSSSKAGSNSTRRGQQLMQRPEREEAISSETTNSKLAGAVSSIKKPDPRSQPTLYPKHIGYSKNLRPDPNSSKQKTEKTAVPASDPQRDLEEEPRQLQENPNLGVSSSANKLGLMNIYDRLYEDGKKSTKLKREGLSHAEIEAIRQNEGNYAKERNIDGVAVGKRLYEDGMKSLILRK